MFPAPNLDPLGIFVYSSITGLKINNFQTSLQRHVPVSNFWRLKLFASTETCKVPQTAALSCLSNQWRMFATCATVETDLFPKLKFYFQCNFSYKTKTLNTFRFFFSNSAGDRHCPANTKCPFCIGKCGTLHTQTCRER